MLLLRLVRRFSGMTIHSLAKQMGISSGRLSMVERGLEQPARYELDRLASVISRNSLDISGRLLRRLDVNALADGLYKGDDET